MGKGSKPRPVDKQTFDQNFDKIFGKPKETDKQPTTEEHQVSEGDKQHGSDT
jgi:hypothetical protein